MYVNCELELTSMILNPVDSISFFNTSIQKELDLIDIEWEDLKLRLEKINKNVNLIPEDKSTLKRLLEK